MDEILMFWRNRRVSRDFIMKANLHSLFVLACGLMAAGQAIALPIPQLRRQGSATELIVDGRPFVMLGGELHNSSSTGLDYMNDVWPKLKKLHLNTVLAAVSWELVEPEEGNFDFALVDGLIRQAREENFRLVLLWFGSWKNGVSSYAPAWVKTNLERFPRCQGASNRNTKDILTPLSPENQKADARAFAALMRHLRLFDGEQRTVLMMQVENEVGIRPEPRDLSARGDAAFASEVPNDLMRYLAEHKDSVNPEMRGQWEQNGFRQSGTWSEVFGKGPETAEIFSAWHYAHYINAVAHAGKAEYPLPMYVNAWLRSPGAKPGDYPSGGPLAHVMDIWKAGAPDIDFLAPDIYLPIFKEVCAAYSQPWNPLMIPEARTDNDAPGRAFWAIGEKDALGFAPFGIEHMLADHPLGDAYAILEQLQPLITEERGSGRMAGIYRQDHDLAQPKDPVKIGDYTAQVRYVKWGIPDDAARYGLIIQTAPEEFIVAGYGIEVNFRAQTPGPRSTELLSVEMGRYEAGRWVREMQLNGDETAANNWAKIPPNPSNSFLDPTKPRILKVRVYRHD